MRPLLILCLLISIYGCASNRVYHQALDAAESENYQAAVALWQPLAAAGDVRSQFKLGELYHDGLGVSPDIAAAIRWYTLAAEQGHVDAQNNLGIIYDEGDQVSPDFKTAIKWYTLAAEQGDPGAQFNLGAIYLDEEGTVHDPMRAYMWWGIAAYLGNDLAGSQLEYAAQDLSDQQVTEARILARKCVRKKFKNC